MFEKIAKIKLYTSLFWIVGAIAIILAGIPFLRNSRAWLSLYLNVVFYGALFVWCYRSLRKQGIMVGELVALSTFKKERLGYLLWGVPLLVGTFSIMLFSLAIIVSFTSDATLQWINSLQRTSAGLSLPLIFTTLIYVLVAPFVEEVFFRGIVFNKWAVVFGVKKAVIGSAILFTLAHGMVNPWHIVFGIAMCIFYIRGGGLWLPILAHIIDDFISKVPVLFSGAPQAINQQDVVGLIPYCVAGFLLSFPFVILFFRRYWPQLPIKR